MSGQVTISITYPMAVRRESPHGVWYSSGLPDAEVERLAVAADPRPAAEEAVHGARNASVIFVEMEAGTPVGVTVWRGLLGVHEVFYAQMGGGGWYLTDHFHNAIAAVPEPQRQMSDHALLQHYVGAGVYGRATYSRGVDRLSYGDRLDIDLHQDTSAIVVFSRHTSTATDEPMNVHLDRLDGAFEDVIDSVRSLPRLGVGFSGGVDSTLLLAYLGNDGIPLTLVPGVPEFAAETEYARGAARLLGREIVELPVAEADYLHHLEHSIETMGMPVESSVVPVLARLYEHESSVFVLGEGADSAFGSGRGIRRLASLLSNRAGRTMLGWMEGDGKLGRRAHQIGEYAALFAQPPLSPDGYAASMLQSHGDLSGTLRIFGEPAVAALNRHTVEEVVDRVELETAESDGFFRHIELAQWRVIFADLAMGGTHDAQALGKSQVQPYLSWRVISEHLKVPARSRYYKGFTGKWMLKELLTRRVKEYKTNKRKLPTGLPFERFFEAGPLTGVWDRYEIPDVIPQDLRFEVRTTATPLTWKAITHAIWEARVMTSRDLVPLPASVSDRWPKET
jgi:asparagine synthetase B (glutamine-hydrolysing)